MVGVIFSNRPNHTVTIPIALQQKDLARLRTTARSYHNCEIPQPLVHAGGIIVNRQSRDDLLNFDRSVFHHTGVLYCT